MHPTTVQQRLESMIGNLIVQNVSQAGQIDELTVKNNGLTQQLSEAQAQIREMKAAPEAG